MNLIELTSIQINEISILLARGKLKSVPADHSKAAIFLSQAAEAIENFANVKGAGVLYDISYNACHAVGEAMLASYGYKTSSGDGQHATIGEFLAILFHGTSAQESVENFDGLRRSRNGRQYEAKAIGISQAIFASKTAQTLFNQGINQLNRVE